MRPNTSFRRLTAIWGLSSLFLATIHPGLRAAPAAKPDYWPMKLGNSWTLSMNMGKDIKMSLLLTVTSVKKEGAATVATIDYKMNDRSIQVETYRASADGLIRTTGGPGGAQTFNPPIPVIKYPLRAGSSWKWNGAVVVQGHPVKALSTFTASGPVTVKTAAGTFKAMKIHSALMIESQGKMQSMPNDYWYAAGVGLVKQEANLGGNKIAGELTSYKLK